MIYNPTNNTAAISIVTATTPDFSEAYYMYPIHGGLLSSQKGWKIIRVQQFKNAKNQVVTEKKYAEGSTQYDYIADNFENYEYQFAND